MAETASRTELLETNAGASTKENTVSTKPASPTEEAKYSAEVLKKIAKPVSQVEVNDDGKHQSITLHIISDLNNSEWRTPGDRELRKIIHSNGEEETLYFTPDKYHHKKLFTSFTIDTVSVDTNRETFRMKFYLQFNWIFNESDYRSLYEAAVSAQEQNKPQILMEWEPSWYPEVEFENVVAVHSKEWKSHPLVPQKGAFRLSQYKKWGNDRNSTINSFYREQDFGRIKWICAELECDITFREELELYSYPFDVQDLSCCFRIKRNDTPRYAIFSYPNYFNADATVSIDTKQNKKEKHPLLIGVMDPSFSQLDEWDVANCLIEFEFKKTVLSIKLARRWRPVVINTLLIIFLMSALSFTVFTVEFQDTASRLELTMTLILTAVLFDTQSGAPKPYLTYLDKYIFTSYGYLTAVMIENALAGFYDEEFDEMGFWILLILFLLQHIIFVSYAVAVRHMENRKILMRYEDVKKFNKRRAKEQETFVLQLDQAFEASATETRIRSTGINKYRRCLSVSAKPWEISHGNKCCGCC